MLGTLTAAEIEALLHAETVGRIGCADAQRTYVVPISYAYDGAAIYGHSLDGLKLRMMRERPAVCF
jgi:nitroimidazol reductase NimA-like FMN-containing flavoprotein (pyridoxamine 5'-phosphate oxidase superfamily)